MADPIGGTPLSVKVNNREFALASDSATEIALPGFTNTMEANSDGSARLLKMAKLGQISTLTVTIDESRGDYQFLQRIENLGGYVPCQVVTASGAEYNFRGQIVELQPYSTATATATFNLGASGGIDIRTAALV